MNKLDEIYTNSKGNIQDVSLKEDNMSVTSSSAFLSTLSSSDDIVNNKSSCRGSGKLNRIVWGVRELQGNSLNSKNLTFT